MDDFWGVNDFLNQHGGVDNFRCFAQLNQLDGILPSLGLALAGDRFTWVECCVDESRYKVADGYKITLRPLQLGFAYEHYEQSDFMQRVKRGSIIPKTDDGQRVEHVCWAEPLYGKAYLVHEGDVVR